MPTFYKNLSEKANYEVNKGSQQGTYRDGQYPCPEQIDGYTPPYCGKTFGSAYSDDRTSDGMGGADRNAQLFGNE